MARQFMGGDFRAIRRAPAPVEEQPDPRLALVDLFAGTQVFRPEGTIDLAAPLPEGFIDLSGDAPDYSGLFVEDPMVQQAMDLMAQPLDPGAQEPAGQPEPDTGADGPVEVQTVVDEAPVHAEPVAEPKPPVAPQDEQDYDPIAAVLG